LWFYSAAILFWKKSLNFFLGRKVSIILTTMFFSSGSSYRSCSGAVLSSKKCRGANIDEFYPRDKWFGPRIPNSDSATNGLDSKLMNFGSPTNGLCLEFRILAPRQMDCVWNFEFRVFSILFVTR